MTTAFKILAPFGYAAIVILGDVGLKAAGLPTISTAIQGASRERPIIAFAFGLVFGGLAVHFFPF